MDLNEITEPLVAEMLRSLYRVVYGRVAPSEQIDFNIAQIKDHKLAMDAIIGSFVNSAERIQLEAERHGPQRELDAAYHAPRELEIHEVKPRRIALLGSCLTNEWNLRFCETCPVDFLHLNFVAMIPDEPPHPASEYDFQIVQLPLRAIFPETEYLALRHDDPIAFEGLFETACQRLEVMLETHIKWNSRYRMLTFVANFMTPQQNPIGRFGRHNDLRNPVYFIERLSRYLEELVDARLNAYILDINKISKIYGARFHQDDAQYWFSHHGLITDHEMHEDAYRLDPPRSYYQTHPERKTVFIDAIWAEAIAMYRTLRGEDAVKLVILDLDDTLWRGVAAEGAMDRFGERVREGWPIGVSEALWWLRSRGILLAVASKNDEGRIRELWSDMTNDLVRLEDFAVLRINWRPKVVNVAEILQATRILPKNVLFVDDNPVERAAVQAAYPEIRVLGGDIYDLRRVLLWAPELQTPVLTEESARRTEMVRAQLDREALRVTASREEFLASLNVTVTLHQVESAQDSRFERAFELLNKTNQFNTTGERWGRDQAAQHFVNGWTWLTFEVEDAFTRYGLVGVVILKNAEIVQWAMSCRVLGLDVEHAVLGTIAARLAGAGAPRLTALFKSTGQNFLCRGFYETAGLKDEGDLWTKELSGPWPTAATHVRVVLMV